MKNIQKNGCPLNYTQWCKKVAGTDKEDYNEIPPVEKQSLFDALIAEQGSICGYTMKRIDRDTAHIEHIKPQSICRTERQGSDLEYKNLIACYPRDGMKAKYRYGAQQKRNWWENDGKEFVSPLYPKCESLFHFDLEGNITASNVAAAKTIEVLALDHRSLTEDRKRVMEEFIYGPNKKNPISQAAANRAISHICNIQDGQECYYEFCVAIQEALKHYINFLKKITRQKKSSSRRN
jgi:uncharacterized protein (TIGR02646 family)